MDASTVRYLLGVLLLGALLGVLIFALYLVLYAILHPVEPSSAPDLARLSGQWATVAVAGGIVPQAGSVLEGQCTIGGWGVVERQVKHCVGKSGGIIKG